MKVGKYEIVTLEFYMFGHTVKMTQKYIEKYDMGHYSYVVSSHGSGHQIIEVGSTSGSCPEGKISQALAKELYERAIKNWDEFVKFAEIDNGER